ncbi:hypothetical protein FRC06_008703 [Ceratobasidium sp. 370]|nr:hypothetical protein FRC06_008703 [Ceratobasidium sp. 370]
MSSQGESIMSTPVSVHEMTPAISDIGSSIFLDEVEHPKGQHSTSQAKSVHPEFAFADGNIEIQTSDRLFWIHEYQLSKFNVLAHLIKQTRGDQAGSNLGQRTKLACDQSSADFANAFRVVYASGITSSLEFDADTLTSTLRIATVYNYPGLRNFAISRLEKAGLSAIERIQLSDELLLPSWEKPAFTELCRRPDAITQSEAQVLGVERFAQVARIREAEQRRRFVDSLVQSLKKHCLIKNSSEAPAIPKFKDVGPAGKQIPGELPKCDCRVQEDKDKKTSVAKCKQHDVAPQVLTECQSLLKEHNKLADGLNDLGKAIFAKPSGGNEVDPLDSELNKAPWIRAAGNN